MAGSNPDAARPLEEDSAPEKGALATFPGELYVKDVHKAFGVTKALDGVSFSANFGEIHAIVGGNGCGKSTLAKVLAGVLPVDRGKVSVLGRHPTTPAEAREIGIAMVFQEVLVADHASVTENLFMGADGFWSRALSYREKIERARTLMRELADDDIDPEAEAGDLPLGLKAWITIGRALLREPKVLVLDESSAALDFDSTERLFAKMRELRDKGSAILIVTHRIAELIRISDRATVMRDGRNVGVLDKSEISEKNLLQLMTGRSREEREVTSGAHEALSDEVVLRSEGMKIWPEAQGIDFELRRGEIVGVTGLDGHGQEEFVRALAGVEPAHEGAPEVRAGGRGGLVRYSELDEAKANGISFVSGDRKREGILPNLSIFENLTAPLYRPTAKLGRLRFVDWLGLASVYDWEVERLSIKTGPRSNLITSLSGGNQQKVLIGRSFALHPSILVLNDPARGIDVEAKSELYAHLRQFAAEGSSVVYMSSELEEFVGFCSRVVVFRNGSIFDEFHDEDVEPVGILEGMFGQNRGSGTAQRPRAAGDRTHPRSGAAKSGHSDGERAAEHRAPGVVDYREGDDVEGVLGGDKIKVTFFD